jgi:hypothetical protein
MPRRKIEAKPEMWQHAFAVYGVGYVGLSPSEST